MSALVPYVRSIIDNRSGFYRNDSWDWIVDYTFKDNMPLIPNFYTNVALSDIETVSGGLPSDPPWDNHCHPWVVANYSYTGRFEINNESSVAA